MLGLLVLPSAGSFIGKAPPRPIEVDDPVLARVAVRINFAAEDERLMMLPYAAKMTGAPAELTAPWHWPRRLRSAYRPLRHSFGAVSARGLPHPTSRAAFTVAELEALTGLPASAFAPPKGGGVQTDVIIAAVATQLLLAACVWSSLSVSWLRTLEGWQLSQLLLGVLGSGALLLGAVDFELKRGALTTLGRIVSPARQELVLRHEAGHFLVAHLLGCPVQEVELDPWDALYDARFNGNAATIYHARAIGAAMRGASAPRAAVDRAAVVLMAGLAAEALEYGVARGGLGDEVALRSLLALEARREAVRAARRAARCSGRSGGCGDGGGSGGDDGGESAGGGRGGESGGGAGAAAGGRAAGADAASNGAIFPAVPRAASGGARARWAAANAVLLLREHEGAYRALCDALRRRCTVGECAVIIEQTIAAEAMVAGRADET